jgi:hypothetical protein
MGGGVFGRSSYSAAHAAVNSEQRGEFPQVEFTSPEDVDSPGGVPAQPAAWGMDCPPAAQEKAIAAAKAMAEE